MLTNTLETVIKLKRLTLILLLMYVVSIVAGIVTHYAGGASIASFVEKQSQGSLEAIENIFGRFREPVRNGHLGAIVLCSLIVFTLNTLGNISGFTLPGIFIVPVVVTLFLGGWIQGISLGGIRASSFTSLFLYLSMGCLEWITYVIATVAGVNIGLSVLIPKRQDTTSRWKAFKLAWRDAGQLYIIILIILAFQAVFEILYVRKVLQMGGTGVPLAPY